MTSFFFSLRRKPPKNVSRLWRQKKSFFCRLRRKTLRNKKKKNACGQTCVRFKKRVADSRNTPSARVARVRHFAVNVCADASAQHQKCALVLVRVVSTYSDYLLPGIDVAT